MDLVACSRLRAGVSHVIPAVNAIAEAQPPPVPPLADPLAREDHEGRDAGDGRQKPIRDREPHNVPRPEGREYARRIVRPDRRLANKDPENAHPHLIKWNGGWLDTRRGQQACPMYSGCSKDRSAEDPFAKGANGVNRNHERAANVYDLKIPVVPALRASVHAHECETCG